MIASLLVWLVGLTFFGGLFYCAFQVLYTLRGIRVELSQMNQILLGNGGREKLPTTPAGTRE